MDQNLQVWIAGKKWDPSKCKHAILENSMKVYMAEGSSWRHAEADPVVEVRRCIYCKKLQPIEPSNDTDAAQMEERAALLVQVAKEHPAPLPEWTDAELIGYLEAAQEAYGPNDSYLSTYKTPHWTGWLACQITMHDEDQNERQDPSLP